VSRAFGRSRYTKRTDPALAGYSDDELRAELVQRERLEDWVTDEDIRMDLATRKHNRAVNETDSA
jgi:hypothetical protein